MQDDAFFVYVKLKGEVFRYSEKVPRNTFKLVDEGKQYLVEKFFIEDVETLPFFNGTLKCGLKLPIKTSKMALTDRQKWL
jgi:hypothetical protein